MRRPKYKEGGSRERRALEVWTERLDHHRLQGTGAEGRAARQGLRAAVGTTICARNEALTGPAEPREATPHELVPRRSQNTRIHRKNRAVHAWNQRKDRPNCSHAAKWSTVPVRASKHARGQRDTRCKARRSSMRRAFPPRISRACAGAARFESASSAEATSVTNLLGSTLSERDDDGARRTTRASNPSRRK